MKRAAPSSLPVILAAGVIALAVGLAYANSLRVPFLFDDQASILRNASIRDLWSPAVLLAPLDATGATGRPLVNLSLALNYAAGGNDVRGYHAVNLLLHALSALLVFGAVRRTLEAARRSLPTPPADGHRRDSEIPPYKLAVATALLWALHPLQTESVTCIIQRTELLGGFFLLLTLYCSLRAMQASAPARGWTAAAIAACTLGMAAKEIMAAAPILVLLYDRTFAAGSFRAAWQQRRRLYLGLALSWLVLAALLSQTPQRNQNVGFGLGVSSWEYLLTQCRALPLYLKLSLWPHPLVMDYGTGIVRDLGEVLGRGLLVLALLGGTAWALWRRPVLGFVGAWFFVILAPSSSFIPLTTQTIAEHRMYLPLLSVLLLVVAGLARLPARVFLPVGTALALVAAGLTWQRNGVYATRLSIWQDTAAHAPDNHRAHYNLGNALVEARQPAAAIASYEAALRLKPQDPTIAYNLASTLLAAGRGPEAIGFFETALRGKDAADIRLNLAVALAQAGRVQAALPHFQRAVELEPRAADLRTSLAQALHLLGRTAEAVREYQTALQLDPRNRAARAGLAGILQSRP